VRRHQRHCPAFGRVEQVVAADQACALGRAGAPEREQPGQTAEGGAVGGPDEVLGAVVEQEPRPDREAQARALIVDAGFEVGDVTEALELREGTQS